MTEEINISELTAKELRIWQDGVREGQETAGPCACVYDEKEGRFIGICLAHMRWCRERGGDGGFG